MNQTPRPRGLGQTIKWAMLAGALAIASGCATKQQTGGVVGAGAGAAAGAAVTRGSTVGTLIGAVIGAAVGSEIGRQMDEEDRRRAAYALEHTASGETYEWINPDTGQSYSMVPAEPYAGPSGPCRPFTVVGHVDGHPDEINGTACRQPDGTWRMN